MDSIEKALRKAREQRRGLPGARPGNTAQTPPIARAAAAPGAKTTRILPVSERVLRDKRVIAGFTRDARADLFRMLRVQVLQRLASSGGTTLGICSPNPEEGKTLIGANLAVSMAMDANHTVLLVDLDLRRPSLAQCFGLAPRTGLSDYLFGGAPLSDCLVNPGIERLVLLPAGRALSNSSEALTLPQMINLAQELKVRYPDRFVIYDLPPLLTSDDALVFLPRIDATLLVVCEGLTQTGEIQRAMDLLEDRNLLGTVLNRSAEGNSYPYY